MSVSSKQATCKNASPPLQPFPDLFRTSTSTEEATAPFVRIDVPHDGYCALYCGSANHNRTSSSSSLPDLVGFNSSSGESYDDELPELESIEDESIEDGRQLVLRHFASRGHDLDLGPAARAQRAFEHSMDILSNDYCPLVAGGTRDFVMYCGARCYNQRRRANTGYDVLSYAKSLKRFKTKPSLNISVEEYFCYCHTNVSVYVKVD